MAHTIDYTKALGRRKTAVARVRVFTGKTPILVNDMPISEYFPGPMMQQKYQKPFKATDTYGQYSATIKVEGGGKNGQLDAVVHGLSRALDKIDTEAYHTKLKIDGLLTRDPRARERRKYGHAHSARSMKQSPKR